MNPVRPDLLELSAEALMALANPGLVKRAQKELAEGQVPRIQGSDDGTLVAEFGDGQRTTLAAGRAPREAQCTCPASGWCRHRVALVLAWQLQCAELARSRPESAANTESRARSDADPAPPWSPAHFTEAALLEAFAPATLELANRLAAAQPVIRLSGWSEGAGVPMARLPLSTVRFFSRSSLLHARCDCSKGSACEHVVLALWAFREAHGELAPGVLPQTSATEVSVQLGPRRAAGQRDGALTSAISEVTAALDAWLLQLWLDGASQSRLALAASLAALLDRLRAQGWSWLEVALEELQLLLEAQHERSSRFDPRRLLMLVAELPARLASAQHAAGEPAPALPARQILGVGVKGEVALDHLRLVALGLQCWRDDRGESAQIVFVDPDTQTLTVLERDWSSAEQGPPLLSRRVAGHSLRQLAGSQVVTRAAKRRANGQILIAASVRQTSVLPLAAAAWDALAAPLRQRQAADLVQSLRTASPDFVRPGQVLEHLHVLPIAQVLDWGWDAAVQSLRADLDCGEHAVEIPDPANRVHLVLPHATAAPQAINTLAAALSGHWGQPRAVAGSVRLLSGQLMLQPLSVLTTQRIVVLQAEEAAPMSLPLKAEPPLASAAVAAVDQALELLTHCLRQGLRHQGGGFESRITQSAETLSQQGLSRCAQALRWLLLPQGREREYWSRQLAGLILTLAGLARES